MPDELLKEEVIQQVYKDEKGKEHILELRRIAWWDTVSGRAYEFITNNFVLQAAMMAAIYKYRFQIELFFEKLQQNFQLEYFVGANKMQLRYRFGVSLSLYYC